MIDIFSSFILIFRYANSVENAPKAGRYVARFLKSLITYGIPKDNIHLVGFSLGVNIKFKIII
jgi:hypothetical protein